MSIEYLYEKMPERKTSENGVVLLLVLSVILVIVILSGVVLAAITSQSRLTQHQINRIKAYYAGKGIMNYALNQLRKGLWVPGTYCLGNCSGLGVFSPTGTIPPEPDFPSYNILVTISPGSPNTIVITTEYTS